MRPEELEFQNETEDLVQTRKVSGKVLQKILAFARVRNIEARNPEAMPIRFRLLRTGAQSNVHAAALYRHGHENKGDDACDSCCQDFAKSMKQSSKLFAKCVSIEGVSKGACANCVFNNGGANCSLNTENKANKANKANEAKAKAKETAKDGEEDKGEEDNVDMVGMGPEDELEERNPIPARLTQEEISRFLYKGIIQTKGIPTDRAEDVARIVTSESAGVEKTMQSVFSQWRHYTANTNDIVIEFSSIQRKISQLLHIKKGGRRQVDEIVLAVDPFCGEGCKINVRDGKNHLTPGEQEMDMHFSRLPDLGLNVVILMTEIKANQGGWAVIPQTAELVAKDEVSFLFSLSSLFFDIDKLTPGSAVLQRYRPHQTGPRHAGESGEPGEEPRQYRAHRAGG